MTKILILKDKYNSFEQYYLEKMNSIYDNCEYFYNSSTIIRKIITHFGLIPETGWYGNWKNKLDGIDLVIVFDSLHTSKLLKFIRTHSGARLIYWHWNPIKTEKEKKIVKETTDCCEHWTFNPIDAEKYGMIPNNQFFFFQERDNLAKENKAFFVGADKGRYDKLVSIASIIERHSIMPDFHIIDKKKRGRFYQKGFMNYNDVLDNLKTAKIAIDIVQEGQTGLTTRALEAMFFGTKLLTNNHAIKQCPFYKKENIYIMGKDENNIKEFLNTPFVEIETEKLYPYSAQGWIEKFLEE